MRKKGNVWVCLAYPESTKSTYREALSIYSDCHLAVSPLHDRDVTDEGQLKKEHYHVLMHFDSDVTLGYVQSICKDTGFTNPMVCENEVGYFRYLTHEDNPNKAQYSKDDIEYINGYEKPQEYLHPLVAISDVIFKEAYSNLFVVIDHFRKDYPMLNYIQGHTYAVMSLCKEVTYMRRIKEVDFSACSNIYDTPFSGEEGDF